MAREMIEQNSSDAMGRQMTVSTRAGQTRRVLGLLGHSVRVQSPVMRIYDVHSRLGKIHGKRSFTFLSTNVLTIHFPRKFTNTFYDLVVELSYSI